ncbi:MAG: hypothetical protein ACRBK7_09040 [Acidimicrobiales bacterium]
MSEILDSYAPISAETTQLSQPLKQRPRTGAFLFGVLLIGVGSSTALAAQTPLSLAQTASICLLVCAAAALGFLITRGSRR